MDMKLGAVLGLIGAALGMMGTAALYKGSWADRPTEGGVFGSPALAQYNLDIAAENVRRKRWRAIGLGLLFASFCAQAAASLT